VRASGRSRTKVEAHIAITGPKIFEIRLRLIISLAMEPMSIIAQVRRRLRASLAGICSIKVIQAAGIKAE